MNFSLKGFDSKNKPVNLPDILWFEHFMGDFGFKETLKICFFKNVSPSLTRVVVTNKDNIKQDFFVDRIELNSSYSNFFCIVFLKNNLCRLFENQVLPTIHETFTLKIMLEKYAKEHSLNCAVKEAYSVEIENFFVDLGMTPLDVIKFFFLCTYKMDIFLYDNKNLGFPALYEVETFFGDCKDSQMNCLNYTKLKTIDDRSKLISDAYFKVQDEEKFSHLSQQNKEAINLNIKRVKCANLPLCWQVLPKEGSDYIILKENKNRITYLLTTDEDVKIYPGMLVMVEEISLEDELVVLEVLTSVKETGKETKILLRKYDEEETKK